MKGRVNTGGGGGLNASVILVTAPTGSTVTCTKGGTTKTAVEKNGLWAFRGIENGEWTVKATKGGQSTSQPVNVTQFDVYRVTLAYFNATIVTTFPTDCTSVTCKKDAVTLSVPSGSLSSGSYTFKIPEVGEWTLYATNGTKEKTVTVTVAKETEYSAKLNFELVILDGSTGNGSDNWEAYAVGNGSVSFTSSAGIVVDPDGYVPKLISKNAWDLTDYTTLTFYISRPTNTMNIRCGVGKPHADYGYITKWDAYSDTTSEATRFTVTVDITSITSTYIGMEFEYGTKTTISKIIAS